MLLESGVWLFFFGGELGYVSVMRLLCVNNYVGVFVIGSCVGDGDRFYFIVWVCMIFIGVIV